MLLNQYSVYSYKAGDFSKACDDKILVDLKKLDALNEYDEVIKFVDDVFGVFVDIETFEYPNNIKVTIQREENSIAVLAKQNEKCILGERWRFEPNDD